MATKLDPKWRQVDTTLIQMVNTYSMVSGQGLMWPRDYKWCFATLCTTLCVGKSPCALFDCFTRTWIFTTCQSTRVSIAPAAVQWRDFLNIIEWITHSIRFDSIRSGVQVVINCRFDSKWCSFKWRSDCNVITIYWFFLTGFVRGSRANTAK